MPELEFLLSRGYSTIGLTETFLTGDDPDSLLLVGTPGYIVFRSDRIAGCSGGAAAVSSCFACEAQTLSVYLSQKNLLNVSV